MNPIKKQFSKFKTAILALAFLQVFVSTAQVGESLHFDGTDAVTLGSTITTSLNGTNKLTVEAWVKPLGGATLQNIVSNYNTGGGNNMQFLLRKASSNYQFFIGNGTTAGYISVVSAATPTLGVFQHVAGVWNGTVASIYINGVLSGTSSITYSAFSNVTGQVVIGSNSIGETFTGALDELRIWKSARTSCEINTYKNCEIAGVTPNLLANYNFNQGIAGNINTTETTLFDASGNSINGTLGTFLLSGSTSNWIAPGGVISGSTTAIPTPTVTYSISTSPTICLGSPITLTGTGSNATNYSWSGGITNAVAFTPTASNNYTYTGTNTLTGCTSSSVAYIQVNSCSGTPGEALHFDANDYVDLTSAVTNSLTGKNKLTVEAWVKPNLGSNGRVIVGNYSTVGNNSMQFLLRVWQNQYYQFFIGSGAVGSYTSVNSAIAPVAGAWTHVAGVWDGTVATIYVNGNASGTVTASIPALPSFTAPVFIGGNTMNEYFFGPIDEVRIWTTARTRCEINTYKACEIPSSAPGLVANYHFNQGYAAGSNPTVTVLNDASGNNYNGTLTTFSLVSFNSNWFSPGGVTSGSTTPLPAPTVSFVAVPSLTTCGAASIALSGNGASTYTWSGGIANGTYFTPTVNATYTLNATNFAGCTGSATANVVIAPAATVSAVTNQSLICSGNSATLTASGANTYSWTGLGSGNPIVVSPTFNTTYTVTGTDLNGCSKTFTITQQVSACAAVNELSKEDNTLMIYPNPNNGEFTLTTQEEANIIIYNSIGAEVHNSNYEAGSYNFNLTQLPKGVYLIMLNSDHRKYRRIIVE